MTNKRSGEIIRIYAEHGIGIIIDENGQDIHFQLNSSYDHIELNSKVNFEIQLTEKGLSAINVSLQDEKSLSSLCNL